MAGENAKVHQSQSPDELTVESFGSINIKAGGVIKAAGTQASAIADLTHAVGTADGTVADVGGAFSQGTLNDNFKECTTKINAILVALRGAGIIA